MKQLKVDRTLPPARISQLANLDTKNTLDAQLKASLNSSWNSDWRIIEVEQSAYPGNPLFLINPMQNLLAAYSVGDSATVRAWLEENQDESHAVKVNSMAYKEQAHSILSKT